MNGSIRVELDGADLIYSGHGTLPRLPQIRATIAAVMPLLEALTRPTAVSLPALARQDPDPQVHATAVSLLGRTTSEQMMRRLARLYGPGPLHTLAQAMCGDAALSGTVAELARGTDGLAEAAIVALGLRGGRLELDTLAGLDEASLQGSVGWAREAITTRLVKAPAGALSVAVFGGELSEVA